MKLIVSQPRRVPLDNPLQPAHLLIALFANQAFTMIQEMMEQPTLTALLTPPLEQPTQFLEQQKPILLLF
jgi:hypothetical protein